MPTTDTPEISQWLTPDKTATLNNCDREPIHIPGTIQSSGFLLCFGADGELLQRSENWPLLPEDQRCRALDELRPHLPRAQRRTFSRSIELDGESYTAIIHAIDGVTVVELEAPSVSVASEVSVGDVFRAIDESTSVGEVLTSIVEPIRELTGFDRVLAYLFDRDGHGTVVAESVVEGMSSLLGLRFPSTDIPKQARRLCVLQRVRQVVDTTGPVVSIVPRDNPVLGGPLNLAYSQLRGTSPIHLEYMRNLGVAASMTIAVVVDEALVALIACHHRSPRHIGYDRRQTCELISQYVSQRFGYLMEVSSREDRNRALSTQVKLLAQLAGSDAAGTDRETWREIVGLVDADAFIGDLDGRRFSFSADGDVPSATWDAATAIAGSEPDRCTEAVDARAWGPELAGGLLVVPASPLGWVAWYRRPIEQEVVWAGAPPVDPEAKELNPRSSFDAYIETVRGRCEAWTDHDYDVAEVLRRGLAARFAELDGQGDSFEKVVRQLRDYVELLEDNNRSLQAKNEDLRQFAHATSHDFKGPLRTIRSFLPMLEEQLDGQLGERERNWFGFVNKAADNLHRVQQGIWAFSRVGQDVDFAAVDLNEVADGVVASLAADLRDATVIVRELPTVTAIRAQMETVLRNLVQNASKFRDTSRPLRVVVEARAHSSGHIVSVSDNGIGFPPDSQSRVFELFTRVHTRHAEGDGLGLAICRRVLSHHGGWIRADSHPGQGTTFEFFLSERPK